MGRNLYQFTNIFDDVIKIVLGSLVFDLLQEWLTYPQSFIFKEYLSPLRVNTIWTGGGGGGMAAFAKYLKNGLADLHETL